jgi:hypothetical protein
MPDTQDGVTLGVASASLASDVIAALNVDSRIPSRLKEGLLPLHVTFNLPRSNQIVNRRWDALLEEWRGTGDIRDLFADLFSVYLRNGGGKNLDLIEWLRQQDRNAYDRTVKVFLDEEREVLTVSFIVMLMDGGGASAVRVVEDETVATASSYIVARDGSANGKWDLQIFAAPAAYVPTDRGSGDGGGGGCAAAGRGVFLLLLFSLILRKAMKKGFWARALALGMALGLTPLPADAAPVSVGDFATLYTAIVTSQEPSITLTAPVITVTPGSGDITIDYPLTLSGDLGAAINGGGAHIFNVSANGNVTFSDIKFTNAAGAAKI